MGLMGQPRGTSARIVVDGLEGVVGLLERVDSNERAIGSLQSQIVELATVLSALNSNLKELVTAQAPPPKKPAPKAPPAPVARKRAGSKRKK